MIAIIPSWSPRLMLLSSAVLCSATRHRTLLNSGTLVLVHLTAMGTGFLPRKPIVGRGFLKTSCGCSSFKLVLNHEPSPLTIQSRLLPNLVAHPEGFQESE